MNGLALSRAYYETHGLPMLRQAFPDLLGRIAVGLTGPGSECFGFDDEYSRDHDFEPGFTVFLPGEDSVDRRTAFRLERAYDALPKSFGGLTRQRLSPVGGGRHGVVRISDFFTRAIGSPDGTLTVTQWLRLPDSALAEAVNGELFYDGPGQMTAIRRALAEQPRDARLKKLAGLLVTMKQSGAYNFPRCLARGENGAAQLALGVWADAAMRAIFLLNRRYMPYYKWSFRALRGLPLLGDMADPIEYLLTTDNGAQSAPVKRSVLGDVNALIVKAVREAFPEAAAGEDPGDAASGWDLERWGYALNGLIGDPAVRNLHVLYAV